jgi:RNA polymerase sigma-70 factor (ECF subfamily)
MAEDIDSLPGDVANSVDVRERAALQAWAQGNSRAGDKLTVYYFPRIRAYFHRRAPEEYEDLSNETFLQLAKSKDNYRGDGTVQVFIYSIARNVLRQHLRKLGRTPDFDPYTTSLGEAYGKRPSSSLVHREEHRIMLDALQDITSDAQDLLELRYWQELTGPELRDLFGIPEGTVRSRLTAGLKQLRKKYDEISMQPGRELSEQVLERWMRELNPK